MKMSFLCRGNNFGHQSLSSNCLCLCKKINDFVNLSHFMCKYGAPAQDINCLHVSQMSLKETREVHTVQSEIPFTIQSFFLTFSFS